MLQLKTLKLGLFALGLAALAIGASMFLLGPNLTGNAFGHLLSSITNIEASVPDLSAANVDSELRFYSVFWIAYGALMIGSARHLPEQLSRAKLLLALFFLGGVGRALSYLIVGAPHPLFTILMWLELSLPLVLGALAFTAPAANPVSPSPSSSQQRD